MPIRKRPKPPSEPQGELLDLPLDGAGSKASDSSPMSSFGRETRPASSHSSRPRLGDVDTIGSLEPRRKSRRGRGSWLWLVLLLAFPLSGLVGYLLSTDPPVAALSTDLIDFGEVRLGATGIEQTLKVSNQGEQALRLDVVTLAGEAAEEFLVAEDGCTGREVAAQTDCALRLAFAPVSRGARRAQIRVESNAPDGSRAVPLIGVGVAPELTIEPTGLDFGHQGIGGVGATGALRLGNRGTAPLQLGRIELRGSHIADFRTVADACSTRRLEPGERCLVRLAFAPVDAGERRAELSIENDADSSRTVGLVGRGADLSPLLRVGPEALEFVPLPVNQTSPSQTVTVANDGNGPLIVKSLRFETGQEEDAAASFEMATETCTAAAVPAGGSCGVEIRFHAGVEGEARAVLEVDSNAGPEPYRVPLNGAGIAPHIAITPKRLSFGEVAVKASSRPHTLRLASTGSDQLQIGQLNLTGADASSFTVSGCAGVSVAPGEECRLEVLFRPGRAGLHRAELQVQHNAEDERQALPLNGIGVAARLSLNRPSIDFGDVRIGTEARQQLTLSNAGRSELKVLRLRLTGRQAAFELMPAGCDSGTVLGPNAACTLTIVFRPTAAGIQRLQLVIDHSAGSAREVPVNARGTAPPVPEIRLEPDRFDFPDRWVGDRSTIKTLTVSNPGTARLSLEELLIAGEHPDDFQLVAGSCASFVAPGASCTVGIRFVPTVAGQRRAKLLVRHNAATGVAELLLQGIAPQ